MAHQLQWSAKRFGSPGNEPLHQRPIGFCTNANFQAASRLVIVAVLPTTYLTTSLISVGSGYPASKRRVGEVPGLGWSVGGRLLRRGHLLAASAKPVSFSLGARSNLPAAIAWSKEQARLCGRPTKYLFSPRPETVIVLPDQEQLLGLRRPELDLCSTDRLGSSRDRFNWLLRDTKMGAAGSRRRDFAQRYCWFFPRHDWLVLRDHIGLGCGRDMGGLLRC